MHSPLNAKLGILTEDLEDGSVRLSLDTDASLRNELGSVHGGIIMLLVDGAMGRAAGRTLAPGQICATVQFSSQFLAPAAGRLSALGRVVRRGRTIAFAEGEVRREDGTVVARAHGTWVIR
ncbi:MAG: PaaI family thioesterase [Planctomycetes bacterium]|nr:PaaI family thioesterase [Planctomycetota bacterium]